MNNYKSAIHHVLALNSCCFFHSTGGTARAAPGLGTPVNLDTAYAYFVTAASHNDPLGHNGLGYIYFRGSNAQAEWERSGMGRVYYYNIYIYKYVYMIYPLIIYDIL